jgi:glutamyl/glutaminyl-tRNA synthetase
VGNARTALYNWLFAQCGGSEFTLYTHDTDRTCSESRRPEFDKLLPLIEDGATLGIGISSVRERAVRFVGV